MNTDDIWDDKDFVKEMDKRTEELESGKVKGYSWDEVKAITRESLSNLKADLDTFYDAIKLDFSGYKFNRDEANER